MFCIEFIIILKLYVEYNLFVTVILIYLNFKNF
jgi:hypothetical protein